MWGEFLAVNSHWLNSPYQIWDWFKGYLNSLKQAFKTWFQVQNILICVTVLQNSQLFCSKLNVGIKVFWYSKNICYFQDCVKFIEEGIRWLDNYFKILALRIKNICISEMINTSKKILKKITIVNLIPALTSSIHVFFTRK